MKDGRRHCSPWIRQAAVLGLLAVVLRLLVPAGWMPAPSAGTLVLCTAQGARLVHLAPDGKAPAHSGDHGVCAFAAAGTLGAAAEPPSPPVRLQVAAVAETVPPPAGRSVATLRIREQSPRAPPLLG